MDFPKSILCSLGVQCKMNRDSDMKIMVAPIRTNCLHSYCSECAATLSNCILCQQKLDVPVLDIPMAEVCIWFKSYANDSKKETNDLKSRSSSGHHRKHHHSPTSSLSRSAKVDSSLIKPPPPPEVQPRAHTDDSPRRRASYAGRRGPSSVPPPPPRTTRANAPIRRMMARRGTPPPPQRPFERRKTTSFVNVHSPSPPQIVSPMGSPARQAIAPPPGLMRASSSSDNVTGLASPRRTLMKTSAVKNVNALMDGKPSNPVTPTDLLEGRRQIAARSEALQGLDLTKRPGSFIKSSPLRRASDTEKPPPPPGAPPLTITKPDGGAIQPGDSSVIADASAMNDLDKENQMWCTVASKPGKWREIDSEPLVHKSAPTDHIEASTNKTSREVVSSSTLEFQEFHRFYYRDVLKKIEHMHFLLAKEDEQIGPIIISLENSKKKDNQLYHKGLLRTKKGDIRFVIPATNSNKERVKHIKQIVPDLANLKLVEAKDVALSQELIKFEEQSVVTKYKFGVVLWKDGQDEDEMFSNNSISDEFNVFLSMLGDQIELHAWPEYRGGLDITNGTTGTHSVYRRFNNSDETLEIMYHVAPLLPFYEKDTQQLERKRHVGNDVVNVVYVEGTEPMPVGIITSHFTYVFILVRLEQKMPPKFRVAVLAKEGVRPFGPALPDPPVFDANEDFSNWLCAKLINAERAAMFAKTFATKNLRTRTVILQNLCQNHKK